MVSTSRSLHPTRGRKNILKSDRAAVNPTVSTRFRALQHRNFQLFIAGQLVSLIGTWMQTTAQLWLVYKLTGSAALLGVSGFAIVRIGEGWCFFLNGLSFAAVIVALLLMRIERTEIKPSKDSPLKSFVQGFQFAMSDLPVRSALLLLSVLSLFGLQYAVFLPIYANDILKGGARMLGLLMSAAGAGAVLGALQFAARTHYRGLARWIAATSTTCAVGLIIFSQARIFWLCAVVLFVVGFAATSQMAATNTLIQNRVPDELRSRVMAVYATMFMGVQPIGALIAGGLAKHIGAQATLTAFGSLMLLGSLLFIVRVVMRLEGKQTAAAD